MTSPEAEQDDPPPPPPPTTDLICEECCLLHQSAAAIIQDWCAGIDPIDTSLQFTRTNSLLPKSHTCFLCARLWYMLRLVKHCLYDAVLMTEAETLDFLQGPDLQDIAQFKLSIARHSKVAFIGHVYTCVQGINIAACKFTVSVISKVQGDSNLLQWSKPTLAEPAIDMEVGTKQIDDDELVSDSNRPISKMRLMEIRRCLQNCDANHDCFGGNGQSVAHKPENTTPEKSKNPIDQLGTQLQNDLEVSVSKKHKSILPKRLLSIENAGKVKLIDTSDLEIADLLRYATLSHCWGPVPFQTLTCANLEDAKNNIPLQDLGKTFQEAIELCRQLNIQYLWIDSWCIIQDSPGEDDWREHVGDMRNIYGKACFNIAAASSSSCYEGLFRPYQKHLHRSWDVKIANLRFEWRAKGGGNLEILLWRSAPLFRRAWVVQELFLAARVIIFSGAGLYFKCQKGLRAEPEYPDVKSSFHDLVPLMLKHAAPQLSIDSLSAHDLDQAWARKVVDYSGCQLTKKSDRAAAFLSLANYFADKYSALDQPARYLVGGWDHNPVTWLDWQNDSGSEKPVLDSSFKGFPSWSWLSYPKNIIMPLTNGVYFGDPSMRDNLEYMVLFMGRIVIPRLPGDHFGPYYLAQLHFEASLFPLIIKDNEWRPTDAYDADIFEGKNCEVKYGNNTRTIGFQSESSPNLVLPIGRVFVDDSLLVVCSLNFDYQDHASLDQQLECIYLSEKRTYKVLEYRLILVRKLKYTDGFNDLPVYERLGIVNIMEDQFTQQDLNRTPQSPSVDFTNRSIETFFRSQHVRRQVYLR